VFNGACVFQRGEPSPSLKKPAHINASAVPPRQPSALKHKYRRVLWRVCEYSLVNHALSNALDGFAGQGGLSRRRAAEYPLLRAVRKFLFQRVEYLVNR